MKSLLLIILFLLGACAEKRQNLPQAKSEPSAESIESQMQLTNDSLENNEVTNTYPLIASYDKGLDLIKISGSKTDQERYDSMYFMIPDIYYSGYWDSKENKYYKAISSISSSNISYDFIDPERQFEKLLDDKAVEYDSNYIYIGSIDPTNRVYIDSENPNIQIIKTLYLYSNQIYEAVSYPNKYREVTNSVNVYPIAVTGKDKRTYLTNEKNEVFVLVTYNPCTYQKDPRFILHEDAIISNGEYTLRR
ncbi:MAG: hypothetical protein ACRCV0_06965 [Brevinema sp.]